MYSVTGKQWMLDLNENSLVFLTVNLIEILHASTYGNYSYIYIRSKKWPRLLPCRQPPGAAAARFVFARNTSIRVHYKKEGKLSSCFFIYYIKARAVVAVTRVAKMTISQGCHPRRFFFDFI